MDAWPDWWEWELELSPHVLKRMVDRGFTEVDLRSMIECAVGLHEVSATERWAIETEHNGRHWEVIVEPDEAVQLLVVVTAYPVD